MKRFAIAFAAIALMAGCAELPESFRQSSAAQGATTQTDTPDVGTRTPQAAPYPYNPPYGG